EIKATLRNRLNGYLVCVVEDLTPGTAYTFTVEAINPVGFSLPSDPSNEVVPTEDKGTIEITGKRETKTIVVVRGASEGLAVGTKLTPRYKKTVGSQKGKWTRGTKVTLKRENGKFVFRVKLKAKQTLTLKVLAPGGVKSNTIKVSPR
ncbi:MAG: fibronectin type III domain-containing protein, partial [Candidatus Nanopelagicales bacterium]